MKAIKRLGSSVLVVTFLLGMSGVSQISAQEECIVEKIEASPSVFYALEGYEQDVAVKAIFENGESEDVRYDVSSESENEDIAYFEDGKVYANEVGETTIHLYYEDKDTELHVTVIPSEGKYTNRFKETIPFETVFKDIEKFDALIDEYTLDNLFLIVPPISFQKVSVIHTNWATTMKVTVDSSINAVTVSNGTKTKILRKVGKGLFQFGWAGLSTGTELTFTAKDSTGKVRETKVVKVGEGKYEDIFNSKVQNGVYSLSQLMEDNELFNNIMAEYKLDMLFLGIPKSFIENVIVKANTETTSYVVTTSSDVAHVFVVNDEGEQYYIPEKFTNVFVGGVPNDFTEGSCQIEVYDFAGRLLEVYHVE